MPFITAVADVSNLDAAVSSRASQTSVDAVDDYVDTEVATIVAAVDTEVAAIKAKTDPLTYTTANKVDATINAAADFAQAAADKIWSSTTRTLTGAVTAAITSPAVISTLSPRSVGQELAALGAAAPANSTAAHTANRAIYIPFVLDETITVTLMAVYNGTSIAGNVDLGIYSAAGTKQVSSGSTALSGTSAFQSINVADTVLTAGRYYFAVVFDDGGNSVFTTTVSAQNGKAIGLASEASAFPLPATATFATSAEVIVPVVLLSTRSFI